MRLSARGIEAQLLQIERVDKRIDHAHGITLIDPVIQTLRQQCRLTAINPFDKSLHQSPPRNDADPQL